MVVGAGVLLRCRVQPVDLTVERIKAIRYRWGTEDARSGGPILNALTGVYGEEYRRGCESVGKVLGAAIRNGSNAADAGKEAR